MPSVLALPSRLAAGCLAVAAALACPAAAQELSADGTAFPVNPDAAPLDGEGEPQPGEIGFGLTTDLSRAEVAGARITIGAGVGASPEYFGSDDTEFGFTGTARFDYLRLPGGLEFGSIAAPGLVTGFGPRGSVRYIPSRDGSGELEGLADIDQTLEIGLGFGYDAEYARAFADARYGFGGSSAWAGEVGADALFRPSDTVIVNFGPRAAWGSSNFMQTYFGVSEGESTASGLDSYDPEGGFYAVGVEFGARYQFSPAWGVEGRATYDYLVGDAGDSPITGVGSRDQFGGRVLITRTISLGF
jgi:outer membrane scaffolding protein for murein synthesis (MipA/OmpV family)